MPLHSLMFGWEYPPLHCGGLGVACQGIVRGLLHHGARVTLVLPRGQTEEKGAEIVDASAGGLMTLNIPSSLHPYDGSQSYDWRARNLSTDEGELYGANLGQEVERFTALAAERMKNVCPDVIHTHDWMTLEAGIRSSLWHGRPLIAHIHATELDRTDFHPNPWIYGRERLGLLKANRIIAVSDYTRQLLVREYGIPAGNISVLHNGIVHASPVLRKTGGAKRPPLVLFLGRLTVQKGPQHFLQAARHIVDCRPDVRFVVAGEGYLLPELLRMACDLGLAEHVIFAGKVTGDEAMQLYRRADCFVMPSVSEPFGLVALEAITHGAPVVLSRQSGAAEVVRNSLLADFWDTDRMTDCILTILREKPLVAQMRSETPRVLTNLTWEKQAGKIVELYHRLLC